MARAQHETDLQEALTLLEWVADHALPSGVLAEQVNPYTGEPLSVSPLTWSHGEFAVAALKFLEKRQALQDLAGSQQPVGAAQSKKRAVL